MRLVHEALGPRELAELRGAKVRVASVTGASAWVQIAQSGGEVLVLLPESKTADGWLITNPAIGPRHKPIGPARSLPGYARRASLGQIP